jgi:hypothetical protein
MPKKQKEKRDELTPAKKSNASVIVGCNEVLRLNAIVKPCIEGKWDIDVFYSGSRKGVKRINNWYNVFFESGFDVDQGVVVEFKLAKESCKRWRFYGKGVEFFGEGCNCQYSVNTKLICSEKYGEMTLNNIHMTKSFRLKKSPNSSYKLDLSSKAMFLPIRMSFVAEFTDGSSKNNGVYISQDPLIGIGKPRRP